MNAHRLMPSRSGCLAIVILLTGARVEAADEMSTKERQTSHASPIQTEVGRLIREDVAKKYPTSPAKSTEKPNESAGDVVLLESFDVRGLKELPPFAPTYETTMAKFLRTGTIGQVVGKKYTQRYWSSGDAGVVVSFTW